MFAVHRSHPPASSLIAPYQAQGAYWDCYVAEVPGTVTLPDYVGAFYNSMLFRLERSVLMLLAGSPSTDTQPRALAEGTARQFAIWDVEQRGPDQLLLRDRFWNTRSWLMSSTDRCSASGRTQLYFGSVVIPGANADGKTRFSPAFHALGSFHQAYSRALLWAACSSLTARSALPA